MKKKRYKIGAIVFSFVLLGTLLWFRESKVEAMWQGDMYVIAQQGSQVNTYMGSEPKFPDVPSGMLFAGWFVDKECTVPFKGVTDEDATYYAKYLPSGVLSIKLQLKTNKDDQTKTDMRIVSSVDSLDYEKVGFELYFGEDADKEQDPIVFRTSTVMKRVSAHKTGVEYKFSPKVINGNSEYFITGTVQGIAQGKLDSYFYIKPFWVTYDGVTVYGENRYVSAQNGLDVNNINVPIRTNSNPADANKDVKVVVNGKEVTAKLAAYKEGIAHLNVPINAIPVGNSTVSDKGNLLSATKVVLSNDNSVFGIYRNYESNAATTDTSWYDVNPNADEFVIATKGDWEGFAKIVNTKVDLFEGDKVILVKDLTLSSGTVDADTGNWSGETVGTTQVGKVKMSSQSSFTMNYSESIAFSGIFEGDGNTISGYYSATGDYRGLFGLVGTSGMLRNFKLSNHCIPYVNGSWTNGSVAVVLCGSMDNIYADETVSIGGVTFIGGLVAGITGDTKQRITNCYFGGLLKATGVCSGGIAGRLQNASELVMENCWVSGDIQSSGSANGGFIGQARNLSNKINIANCLFSGSVEGTNHTAGFIGEGGVSVDFYDCLQNGIVKTSVDNQAGNITGEISSNSTANLKHIYTTNKFTSSTEMTETNRYEGFGYNDNGASTVNGFPVILSDGELENEHGYINTELNFWTQENTTGVWVATQNGPELKQFTKKEAITDFSGLQRISTDWYYEKYYNGDTPEGGTEYTLETAEDMYGFSKVSQQDSFCGDIVTLTESVDLNPDWTSEQGIVEGLTEWIPIGRATPFEGVFNAQNCTIEGLCVNGRAQDGVGLFGKVGSEGVLQNIQLMNSYLISNVSNNNGVYVSAIAGQFSGTTIDSVFVGEDVEVINTGNYTGGIVGQWNSSGRISNCWFAGTVKSTTEATNEYVGGIVGNLTKNVTEGIIENCLNSGKIFAHDYFGGGIVGGANDNGVSFTIQHCLNIGTVIATRYNKFVGAIVGGFGDRQITCNIEDVYTTTVAAYHSTEKTLELDMEGIGKRNGNSEVNGIVHKVDTEQTIGNNAYIYTELDYWSSENQEGVWVASVSGTPQLKDFSNYAIEQIQNGYTGQETMIHIGWYEAKMYLNGEKKDASLVNETYQIETAADMYGFEEIVNEGRGGFPKDNFANDTINLTACINLNPGWSSTEGVENARSTMKPIGQTNAFCGIFNGNGNTISGLAINEGVGGSGKSIDSNGLFGVVGANGVIQNFELENSYIQVRTTDSSNGWYTGAIVGNFSGSFVDSVYVAKTVTVDTDMPVSGGVVGNMNSNGTISECWFAGTLISSTVSGTDNFSGGIVGALHNGGNGCKIQNCLNTGSITANNFFGGGIVGGLRRGNQTLTIKDCVNSGSVTSTTNEKYFGSVIGGIYESNLIINVDNVYTTTDAHRSQNTIPYQLPGIGQQGTQFSNNVINGNPLRYDSSFLSGQNAYMNTTLDIYSTSNTDGVWAATSSGVELKQFTKNNVIDTFTVFKADMSWFLNDNSIVNGVSTKKDFKITTKEQLYGLANLSQSNNFAGVTITLGDNIVVNADDIADTDKVQWHPIGRTNEVNTKNAIHGYRFAGTFDGNNKTISGLYMRKECTYMALFAGTEVGSMVKNLRIKDSYFEQLYVVPRGVVASVVADCRGDLENIYSNAEIVTNNFNAGGIVAWANAEKYNTTNYGDAGTSTKTTYKNCWFDGIIEAGTQSIRLGGIASAIQRGTVTFENCLFSGVINSEYNAGSQVCIGGLTGTIKHDNSVSGDINTLNLESCISAGKITDSNKGIGVGAVVGRLNWKFASTDKTNPDWDKLVNWTKVNMSNVYASRECYGVDMSFDWHKNLHNTNDYAILDSVQVEGHVTWSHGRDRLMGYCVEIDVDNVGMSGNGGYTVVTGRHQLDFTNDFAMVNSGVPIPRSLVDVVSSDIITDMSKLNAQSGFEYLGSASNGWDLSAAENSGMGNYIKTKEDATKTNYEDFIRNMISNQGYKKYVDNTGGTAVDGVYNAILVKQDGDWVVNVVYLEKTKELTLSVSTIGTEGLSKNLIYKTSDSSTNYQAEGDITFTMSQLSDNVSGNQLFFQLPNGHFIISDGAHDAALDTLLTKLEALVPEGTVPIVDAWIISHQHSDHSGFLAKFWKNPEWVKRVKVEGFYFSEPSDAAFQTDDFYTWKMGGVSTAVPSTDFRRGVGKEYAGLNLLKTTSGEKTPIYRMHTGERYYFNGLIMDVIFTHEQMGLLDIMRYNNQNPDSRYNGNSTCGLGHNIAHSAEGTFNSVSTTVLYTTNGGQKIYSAGDATHLGNNQIVAAYDTCGIKNYFHDGTNDDGVKHYPLEDRQLGINDITGPKISQTLSNINIMVALHHGMNTMVPYTRYLTTPKGVKANTTSATMNQFDAMLFPSPSIRKYSEGSKDVTQYGANEWVIDNLVTNKKAYSYGAGDVVVTFSGSEITIAQ